MPLYAVYLSPDAMPTAIFFHSVPFVSWRHFLLFLTLAIEGKLASKLSDQETRDGWWSELREEIKSHAMLLCCTHVIGYVLEVSGILFQSSFLFFLAVRNFSRLLYLFLCCSSGLCKATLRTCLPMCCSHSHAILTTTTTTIMMMTRTTMIWVVIKNNNDRWWLMMPWYSSTDDNYDENDICDKDKVIVMMSNMIMIIMIMMTMWLW